MKRKATTEGRGEHGEDERKIEESGMGE